MKKIGFLLVLAFFAACTNEAVENGAVLKSTSYGIMNEEVSMDDAGRKMAVANNPVQEQKVIKTANLRFETKDLEATHQRILQLTKEYQGFVQNDNTGKDYGKEYVRMTIRIPSEKFEDILQGISEGVGFFDQKQITQKDVTEEFVDINARLTAKRKLESRYLELLQQAKNVKEMLEIERELSKIREEIEAKEGRLKFLENKVSLSTLNIEFYKTTESKGVSLSYGQKITNALKGGWNGVSVFFLGILYMWPFILILGIVIYFIRRYIKKRRNKK